jgi:hypothetical protein
MAVEGVVAAVASSPAVVATAVFYTCLQLNKTLLIRVTKRFQSALLIKVVWAPSEAE